MLLSTARAILTGIHRLLNRGLGELERRRALRCLPADGYAYSEDYVSDYAEGWLELLKPLKGEPDCRFLEIGSFEGRSANWFLDNILTHENSNLTCVDLFPGHREVRFEHNLTQAGNRERVHKIVNDSGALCELFAREFFDLIYVDGSHRAAQVLLDSVSCWYLLKPGGLLIFDDYNWGRELPAQERPRLALDMFLELLADQLTILERDRQLVVRKLAG